MLSVAVPVVRPDNMDVVPVGSNSSVCGISHAGAEPGVGAPGGSAVGGELIVYVRVAVPSVMPDNMDGIPVNSNRRVQGIGRTGADPRIGAPGGSAVRRTLIVYVVVAGPVVLPDNMDTVPRGRYSWEGGICRIIGEPGVGAPGGSAVGGELIVYFLVAVPIILPDNVYVIPRNRYPCIGRTYRTGAEHGIGAPARRMRAWL